MKTCAIILAAGNAKRMNSGINKLFMRLRKPIISHCIEAFEQNNDVDEIILVIKEDHKDWYQKEITSNGFKKISKVVVGGELRQDSSRNGVNATDADIIIIHDGARPFVSDDVISQSIEDAKNYGVSVVGVKAKDTIKQGHKGFVDKTISRENLWIIQTPQAFKREIILRAHKKATEDNFVGTDDTVLVERLGQKVKITKGHYDNIKITTPDDLLLAQIILENRE